MVDSARNRATEWKEPVMRMKPICISLLTSLVIAGSLLAPMGANAQEYAHRQKTKNEWRNIAIGSGGLSLLGLLKHDNTLTFAGAAGALYSANRYEQDRKSQRKMDRTRAAYFGKDHFYRDGKRYTRRTVRHNGKTYYQFIRG